MKFISKHGPWIVPLFLAFFLGGAQLYHLNEQVVELRVEMENVNGSGLGRLNDAEWRISIIENYCCAGKLATGG